MAFFYEFFKIILVCSLVDSWRGYTLKFSIGELCPEAQPIHFAYHFDRKGTSVVTCISFVVPLNQHELFHFISMVFSVPTLRSNIFENFPFKFLTLFCEIFMYSENNCTKL